MTAVAPGPTTHATADHPFPGLRPFDFEDCEYFFGRDREIKAVHRLLEFSRFIAVIGSSGSGKSSLIRAGLQPLLENERASGGRKWRIAIMHPGNAPTVELADALAKITDSRMREAALDSLESSTLGLADIRQTLPQLGDDPIFLIVDQFEELFRYAAGGITQSGRESEAILRERASHFVELLLEATRKRSSNVFVLITMRSDFIGDCAQFAYLPEAVSATQFLVPGLTRDQREEIIRRPIEEAAKTISTASIEPELVDRLLNDAGDEDDQLPVLQHCLARMWECSALKHELTLELYFSPRIDRIAGALSAHADEVMDKELAGKEVTVQQVFRALSEVDKEGRATRRSIPFQQLIDETGMKEEDVRAVVDRFREDDCSFCTPSFASVPRLTGATLIGVGHEALLRGWKRISRPPTDEALEKREPGWLWLEREDGRTYQSLLTIARGAADATLPLDQVERLTQWWHSRPRTSAWADRYGDDFDRVQRLFGESRTKLEKDEADRAKAQHDRVVRGRQLALLLALFPIIFAATGFIMFLQAKSNNDKTAQLQSKYEGMVSFANAQRGKADAALREAHTKNIAAQRYLALANQLKRVTQVQNQTLQVQNQTLMVTAKTLNSREQSLNITTQNLRTEVRAEKSATAKTFLESGISALEQGDAADAEVFLAAAYHKDPGNDAASILLASARQQVQGRVRTVPLRDGSPIVATTYAADSSRAGLAVSQEDGVTTLWNQKGELQARFKQSDAVTALAIDRNGTVLATGGRDGSLILHFLGSGQSVPLDGHTERINAVAFSPTGKALATTSMDGTVKLWSVDDKRLVRKFDVTGDPQGFPAIGYALKFPDDNGLLACTNLGLRMWNLTTYQAVTFTRPGFPHVPGCQHLATSGDGHRAVTDELGSGGAIAFYDLTSHDWDGRPELAGDITALTFDQSDGSGKQILAAGEDGTVALTDWTMRPNPVFRHRGSSTGTDRVVDAAFTADGSTIIIAQADGTVSMYDLASETKLSLRAQDSVATLALASSSDQFVTAGDKNGIADLVLWHVPRRTVSGFLSAHSKPVSVIAPAPRSMLFATGSQDGRVDLWRGGTAIRRVTTLPFASDGAWVDQLHFDSSGKWLAAVGGRHIRVWGNVDGTPQLATDLITPADALRFSDAWPMTPPDLVFTQRKRALIDTDPPLSQQSVGLRSYQTGNVRMRPELPDATDVLPIGGKDVIAFSRANGQARMISVPDMRTYFVYTGISDAAYCQKTGKVLLGGDWGGLSLVTARDGSRLRYWRDHPQVLESGGHARVTALACSDDGAWLASAGAQDGMIRIWSVDKLTNSKRTVSPIPFSVLELGYPVEISSVRFSPRDGHFILSLSTDGRAQLWNRDSGELLATFALPGKIEATSTAFLFDGRAIAVGYSNGKIGIYPLSSSTGVAATMREVLMDLRGLKFRPQGLVGAAYGEIGGGY
ncbi:MAG: WD40 repeat domain-containing protein [Candidatus Cybelea sp.]